MERAANRCDLHHLWMRFPLGAQVLRMNREVPRASDPFASCRSDFQVHVLLAPDGKPSQPVLLADGLAGKRPVFRRQNTSRCCELRASNGAPHRAGSNADLRVVADALGFSRIAAGHHVKFAIALREPDRGGHGSSIFAERGKTDVVLRLDLGWDRSGHVLIVRDGETKFAVHCHVWYFPDDFDC